MCVEKLLGTLSFFDLKTFLKMTNSPTTIALILRYNCTNIATVIVGFNVHDRIHGF